MVWLEVVGWAGSVVLVLSLAQARVLRFRALNLGASVVLAGYNLALGIWPMVAMNTVIVGIDLFHIARLLRSRDDASTYEVVPVGADEEYVRYLLRRHAADVERHNPGFAWDGDRPGRSAYLVLRQDETVGMVLLSEAGPASGTARVELDYVLPRFRDFSVGKFVYRRGGLLAQRGYARLLAPTGRMVDAERYFPRVGFRREGGALVLDLAR